MGRAELGRRLGYSPSTVASFEQGHHHLAEDDRQGPAPGVLPGDGPVVEDGYRTAYVRHSSGQRPGPNLGVHASGAGHATSRPGTRGD
ncbi:hypothetical protein [Streptomyces sp. CL12]|uniref:hypothetical protein n=1 Tax=Streptomyces sp. CL12 TaxID=3391744 RepID=UPI003A81286B